MNMPTPLRRRARAIHDMMKLKKDALIRAHKTKHPSDPALYRRQKRDIAAEVAKEAWWPVRDFPVEISEVSDIDEKNML